jgi:hypothetical protein
VGGDDENEPKRRVLRRLGPRQVFLKYLSGFFVLTNDIGSIYVFTAWAAMTRTSPNDAFCVAWALGKFSKISFIPTNDL